MAVILWTESNEQFLLDIKEKCIMYKNVHNKKSRIYWWFNLFFSIIEIIIVSFTGSFNFISLSLQFNVSTNIWKDSITGAILLIFAIFSSINKFLKLGERSVMNKNASNNFINLATKISSELSFERKQRTCPRRFIENIESEFKKLILDSPNVTEKNISSKITIKYI